MKLINREISWLSFNQRVLQEAADKSTPLVDRIKFLGIFSNSLDEFFRVRVASVTRMGGIGKGISQELGIKPKKLLKNILIIVSRQQEELGRIYREIKEELKRENIFIIDEKKLTKTQSRFVEAYFDENVKSALYPIMVSQTPKFPYLKGNTSYLAMTLEKEDRPADKQFVLLEVPTHVLGRFVVLPEIGKKKFIMLLDDVIRHNMNRIFGIYDFDRFHAYSVKLTRDAELDLDDDLSKSFLEKISKSVKARSKAVPVRLIYDSQMPDELLKFITSRLGMNGRESVFAGARYHNFKDFMSFPNLGPPRFVNPKLKAIEDKRLTIGSSLFSNIASKDLMIHFPYEDFSVIVDLIREASIDPEVESIKITLYRVAQDSRVINALISAALNGKHVEVILEIQARFDEEANIYWANQLKEVGAEVVFGVPGIKVHCKLCLITKVVKNKRIHFCNVSTGNFNENTAKVYTDHSLFTAHPGICAEVEKVFQFLRNPYKIHRFKHLIVSPFKLRSKMVSLINQEIRNAKAGKPAAITMKMNSLLDRQIASKLYEAGNAGVKLQLIVRGICVLMAEGFAKEADVRVISVVDKFLEHPRVCVFHNSGDELFFIASADMMPRNLDRRVEVACPVYDKTIKNHLKEILEIQLSDNVKARDLLKGLDNEYVRNASKKELRSQVEVYNYLKQVKG